MSSSKKHAADSSQPPPPSKKVKKDLKFVKPDIDLSSIAVASLDQCIVTDNHKDGLCSALDLQLIESTYALKWRSTWMPLQARLLQAQTPYLPTMTAFRIEQEFKDPPTIAKIRDIFKGYQNLEQEVSESRSDLLDAIQYRQLFCLNIIAFGQDGGKPWEKEIEVAATAYGMTSVASKDRYITKLVEAAERHLSRASDRSDLWTSQGQLGVTPSLSAAAVTATTTATTVTTDPAPTSADIPDAWSDAYIPFRAREYIKSAEDLAAERKVVPWDSVSTIDKDEKHVFEEGYKARRFASKPFLETPPGILLHGDSGVGKTELVYSWCIYIKGVLVKIDNSIEGSLRGQSERLLKHLFNEAIQQAQTRPVVLFLDEADQLIGHQQSEHAFKLQAFLKDATSTIMSADVEVYIVGATNSPWDIQIHPHWSRRFQCMIHVKLPDRSARKAVLKTILAKEDELSPQELETLAEQTVGYTANDLRTIVIGHSKKLACSLMDISEWERDGERLVPGTGIRSTYAELSAGDKAQVTVKITLEGLQKHIESGGFKGKAIRKTSSPEQEIKHAAWNEKMNS